LRVKSSNQVTPPVTGGLVNRGLHPDEIGMNFGHQILKASIHHPMDFLSKLELGTIHISNETFDNIYGIFKEKLLTFE